MNESFLGFKQQENNFAGDCKGNDELKTEKNGGETDSKTASNQSADLIP